MMTLRKLLRRFFPRKVNPRRSEGARRGWEKRRAKAALGKLFTNPEDVERELQKHFQP